MYTYLPISIMRISSTENFENTIFIHFNQLNQTHTFGYPDFVLDPSLKDSKNVPKWSMRSRRRFYLGVSKNHSSTVHLVLNPETGVFSPHYHCFL